MIKAPCDRDQNLNVRNVVDGLKNYCIGQVKNLIQIKNTKWYFCVGQNVR